MTSSVDTLSQGTMTKTIHLHLFALYTPLPSTRLSLFFPLSRRLHSRIGVAASRRNWPGTGPDPGAAREHPWAPKGAL